MKLYSIVVLYLSSFSLFAQKNEQSVLKNFSAFNEILSLDSDDFSDLKFLERTLKNKRVIMLGEFTNASNSWLEERIEMDGFVTLNGNREIKSNEYYDGLLIINQIGPPKSTY
ncbi:hypothetical protein QQ008_04700 [Fulvivirgaceae bacterium BMA10]|uniref:Uncharacterized protein n=1 Tax=Splendidivirga corallicola TaxID=3051826 RepID=A0ABT8KLP1_9BACT|nr:hypothetical protein [Fulvivirgaceae bacterium BMA10]